jgi:hypothetical protein
MKSPLWLTAVILVGIGATTAAACGGINSAKPEGDAGMPEGTVDGCIPCTKDSDCGGYLCAKFSSGFFCAPPCQTQAMCSSDKTCVPNEGTTGVTVGVCVAPTGACGANQGVGSVPKYDGGGDVQVADASAACSHFAPPDQSAGCMCRYGQSCQTNGCQYGEWCDTTSKVCSPPPLGCGGTPGTTYDGGAPPMGSVTPSGGKVSRLLFAVIGDTRPPSDDDTPAYPTSVITKIFGNIQALQPRPTFAISTGDYEFASPTGDQSGVQLDIYQGARAQFSNVVFPTMGNHECTGATASNCGPGSLNGNTTNYDNYIQKFLAPINQTNPNYEIDIDATDGSWTSKFLFVAANAWSQTQANWLDAAMTRQTTYTFLVRHEPANSSSAPGVGPAEVIMTHHPYTLSIVGHVHTYDHVAGAREVTIGNGGAPLGGAKNYGFGMINQQDDGNIAVDMVDLDTGLSDPTFHFVVKPDGTNL